MFSSQQTLENYPELTLPREQVMSDRNKELADKVVTAFKSSLSEKALAAITNAEFDALTIMVQEALSTEKREIAELIEGMVKKLKADASITDISL